MVEISLFLQSNKFRTSLYEPLQLPFPWFSGGGSGLRRQYPFPTSYSTKSGGAIALNIKFIVLFSHSKPAPSPSGGQQREGFSQYLRGLPPPFSSQSICLRGPLKRS